MPLVFGRDLGRWVMNFFPLRESKSATADEGEMPLLNAASISSLRLNMQHIVSPLWDLFPERSSSGVMNRNSPV